MGSDGYFFGAIFNVADACVCIGMGVIVLYFIIDIVKDAKKVREKEESEG